MASRTSRAKRRRTSFQWDLESPEATRRFGRRLALRLRTHDTLALIGELGTGKTTFIQGLAAGWGYRREVCSPTFALANEYRTRRGLLFHLDMYRLKPKELAIFPLEEYFGRGLCVIEWGDRVGDRWPGDTLVLELQTTGPRRRFLRIRHSSRTWKSRLKGLAP